MVLVSFAVPGSAAADEAKACRTGHEAYSPAYGPQLGTLVVNLWQAMDEHSLGKTLAQIGIGFRQLPFVLSDRAAQAGWCVAAAPNRAACRRRPRRLSIGSTLPVNQKFGPALAEAGRRFMAMDGGVAKMDAITYLAAAKKAGEDVGELFEAAERGQPAFLVAAALAWSTPFCHICKVWYACSRAALARLPAVTALIKSAISGILLGPTALIPQARKAPLRPPAAGRRSDLSADDADEG